MKSRTASKKREEEEKETAGKKLSCVCACCCACCACWTSACPDWARRLTRAELEQKSELDDRSSQGRQCCSNHRNVRCAWAIVCRKLPHRGVHLPQVPGPPDCFRVALCISAAFNPASEGPAGTSVGATKAAPQTGLAGPEPTSSFQAGSGRSREEGEGTRRDRSTRAEAEAEAEARAGFCAWKRGNFCAISANLGNWVFSRLRHNASSKRSWPWQKRKHAAKWNHRMRKIYILTLAAGTLLRSSQLCNLHLFMCRFKHQFSMPTTWAVPPNIRFVTDSTDGHAPEEMQQSSALARLRARTAWPPGSAINSLTTTCCNTLCSIRSSQCCRCPIWLKCGCCGGMLLLSLLDLPEDFLRLQILCKESADVAPCRTS